MGKPYSLDLRKRIVAYVESGHSARAAGRVFGGGARVPPCGCWRLGGRGGAWRRGRAPRGERLTGAAPFGRWHSQTFIAGIICNGLIAPWVLPGAIGRAAFDTWIETQLAPALVPGTAVILDNLPVHRSPRAAEPLKAKGCWLLPLPACSLDLNPIEMASAKLKAHLRRIGATTFDAVITALGDICDLFTPDECLNCIVHAGYVAE